MIITDISAKNVLKYASLELRNLPREGVIGISGQNESGKSTVGETLCFALFGRTFSLDAKEIEKVIRWGEPSCEVSCRFVLDDGTHYEIARYLDSDGNHSARLSLTDRQDDPLARGVSAVDDALYDLIGYDFDEFVDSFYLAQREITTPHPHSHTVKAMAGIAALEYVAEEIAQEVDEGLTAITDTEADIADADRQLTDLNVKDGELDHLGAERHKAQVTAESMTGRADALEAAARDYQQALPQLRKARAAHRTNGWLAFLVFALALVVAGSWLLLTRIAWHPYAEALGALLREQVPGWSAENLPMVITVAGGLGVLWLLILARGAGLKRRMARLSYTGPTLATGLDEARAIQAEEAWREEDADASADGEVDVMPDEDAEEQLESLDAEPEGGQGPERLADHRFRAVRERIAECRAEPPEASEPVDTELGVLRGLARAAEARAGRLDQAIEEEKARLAQAAELREMAVQLEEKVTGLRRRIDLREMAQELLGGASRSMSHRFNHDLRNLVGRTLPLFTDGRYEHLQIDENLGVRVFSNEKRDYMDLDEASSGTQRQIMLALRLALSQELINSTVLGRQFVFLDEPFAFFDDDRTRSSLKVLPQLSDQIRQVWVCSQQFPEDAALDVHVTCFQDSDRLGNRGVVD
jgi:exonuclease SbcC